jgi:5-methylcytosine-specific restriction protein A
MPTKAPHPCGQPGCPALVSIGSRCEQHKKQEQKRYNSQRDYADAKYYHSAAWQKLRLMKLRSDPLCEDHLARGETVPASHVDHTIARKQGGEDSLSNLRSLCVSCHSSKSARAGESFNKR